MTAAPGAPAAAALGDAACVELCDAASYVFWDDAGTVLASSFPAKPEELRTLAGALGDRNAAIKHGMIANGQRYEVHRHHPPLVYGRTMGVSNPDDSVGAALCGVSGAATPTGRPCFGFITYRMPNLSARMVPLLEAFCEKHLLGGAGAKGAA